MGNFFKYLRQLPKNVDTLVGAGKKTVETGEEALNVVKDTTEDISGRANEAINSINKFTDKGSNILDNFSKYQKPFIGGVGLLGTGLAASSINKKIQQSRKEKLKQQYYLQQMQKHASPIDKIKNFFDEDTRSALKRGGGAAAGMVAVHQGAKAADNVIDRVRSRISKDDEKQWNKFIERFPEFAENTGAREKFNLMLDVSPNLAKHPIMVKSFIDSSKGYDDIVPPDSVQTLAKTQQTFDRNDNGGRAMSMASDIVGNIQETYRSGINNAIDQDLKALEYTNKRYDAEIKGEKLQQMRSKKP